MSTAFVAPGYRSVIVSLLTRGGCGLNLPVGVLTVDGDYLQDLGGRMEVQLGGLMAGTEYDVLDVTGTAS